MGSASVYLSIGAITRGGGEVMKGRQCSKDRGCEIGVSSLIRGRGKISKVKITSERDRQTRRGQRFHANASAERRDRNGRTRERKEKDWERTLDWHDGGVLLDE
jgi:hypothetical protein